MDIADKIKQARAAKGVSQAETARQLDIDPSSYHRLEYRGEKLSIKQATDIAATLGLTLLELLTWNEAEPPKPTAGACPPHTFQHYKTEQYFYSAGRYSKTYVETVKLFCQHCGELKDVTRKTSIQNGNESTLPEWAKSITECNYSLDTNRY